MESEGKIWKLHVLKTKQMNQLSQQALNAVVSNTEDIVEQSMDSLKTKGGFSFNGKCCAIDFFRASFTACLISVFPFRAWGKKVREI